MWKFAWYSKYSIDCQLMTEFEDETVEMTQPWNKIMVEIFEDNNLHINSMRKEIMFAIASSS